MAAVFNPWAASSIVLGREPYIILNIIYYIMHTNTYIDVLLLISGPQRFLFKKSMVRTTKKIGNRYIIVHFIKYYLPTIIIVVFDKKINQ